MAAVELAAVPITREGLLKLRKRRTLALTIVDLLQRDLDVLVKRFFSLVDEVEKTRNELYDYLSESYRALSKAKIALGSIKFRELGFSRVPTVFNFKIREERLLGVRLINVAIPVFKLVESGNLNSYNVLDTSVALDDAVLKVRGVVELIVKLAEVEASIDNVARAMQITRKRINIIQYRFIPEIDKMIKRIEFILEERAREDAVRMRILQKKRKAKAEAKAL